MKPFESPEGTKGVSFEGHTEIGALAAGLGLMVEIVDLGPDNLIVQEATALRTLATDILNVDATLAQDPEARRAMGGDNHTNPTVALNMDDYTQLATAYLGLQVAAQRHQDPLVRQTAELTHGEFAAIVQEQGLQLPAGE